MSLLDELGDFFHTIGDAIIRHVGAATYGKAPIYLYQRPLNAMQKVQGVRSTSAITHHALFVQGVWLHLYREKNQALSLDLRPFEEPYCYQTPKVIGYVDTHINTSTIIATAMWILALMIAPLRNGAPAIDFIRVYYPHPSRGPVDCPLPMRPFLIEITEHDYRNYPWYDYPKFKGYSICSRNCHLFTFAMLGLLMGQHIGHFLNDDGRIHWDKSEKLLWWAISYRSGNEYEEEIGRVQGSMKQQLVDRVHTYLTSNAHHYW